MFDFIVCRAAFKNFADPLGALREMHRVLKPGGEALVIDMDRHASNAAIDREMDGMKLGPINAFITRTILKTMLRKRAYAKGISSAWPPQPRSAPLKSANARWGWTSGCGNSAAHAASLVREGGRQKPDRSASYHVPRIGLASRWSAELKWVPAIETSRGRASGALCATNARFRRATPAAAPLRTKGDGPAIRCYARRGAAAV